MISIFKAAADLQDFVTKAGWPFCIIGGLALQRWGNPRMTRDADMTVLTNFVDDEKCIQALLGRFESRNPDAANFALLNRVLLLRHENGVGLDVALGALDFEARAIGRASWWESNESIRLFTCSAEDLIVHKAFASRDQDWVDVENVIDQQRERLDVRQILFEITPLAEMKEERDSILPRLKKILLTHGLQ